MRGGGVDRALVSSARRAKFSSVRLLGTPHNAVCSRSSHAFRSNFTHPPDSKESAAIFVEAQYDMQPVDRGDPKWKYLNGRLKISIKDKKGETRGETFIKSQGAGLNENQAYHKTLNALKDKLDKDFSGFFMRALGGD